MQRETQSASLPPRGTTVVPLSKMLSARARRALKSDRPSSQNIRFSYGSVRDCGQIASEIALGIAEVWYLNNEKSDLGSSDFYECRMFTWRQNGFARLEIGNVTFIWSQNSGNLISAPAKHETEWIEWLHLVELAMQNLEAAA